MTRLKNRQRQKAMMLDRDRKEALKKGITVKKLREDRLKKNRDTAITAASFLPVGGLAIKGGQLGSKLFNVGKKFLQGAKKTKPAATKLSKTAKTTKPSVPPTKTAKTTKTSKTTKNKTKTKVVPTTTKPVQGPFPKVYKRPIGPKPKTSTRVKNFVRKNKVPIAAGAATLGTTTALLKSKKTDSKPKVTKSQKPNLKVKKPTSFNVNKQKLKKMGPTKDYTGKFVNEKGEVAYDSVGDFFANITGTAKKRARPENRKRIQAATKGATKGIGFTGKSVAQLKNPFKKAGGGTMKKPIPPEAKGLQALKRERPDVVKKMGFMRKGGKVMKMRGGGAATRGIKFNRGY